VSRTKDNAVGVGLSPLPLSLKAGWPSQRARRPRSHHRTSSTALAPATVTRGAMVVCPPEPCRSFRITVLPLGTLFHLPEKTANARLMTRATSFLTTLLLQPLRLSSWHGSRRAQSQSAWMLPTGNSTLGGAIDPSLTAIPLSTMPYWLLATHPIPSSSRTLGEPIGGNKGTSKFPMLPTRVVYWKIWWL
jgi:hypothetical protein